MRHRPERLRVENELGQPRTLAAGEEQFARAGSGESILILGLGPEPGLLADILPSENVSYLECPAFAEQMPRKWEAAIPGQWRKLAPEELSPDFLASCTILVYSPAQRLFPSFWGPVLAGVRLGLDGENAPQALSDEIWLPARDSDLLTRELEHAFAAHGQKTTRIAPETAIHQLPEMLAQNRPKLYFSVNFRGLDPHGEIFYLLREADVDVVVWCVDNPFHLLSGLKSGFWRELLLCVTDEWFMEPLNSHGANTVMHLPLAGWPELYRNKARPVEHDAEGSVVFVGRSEFPDKRGFFSGLKVPDALLDEAIARMDKGQRSDFSWWADKFGIDRMWPGREVRRAGYGAEQSGKLWRTACLAQAAEAAPLTIYGDRKWESLVPLARFLRPPIDYYGPLPFVYESALCNLNMTSFLLPSGLTQRHFDVWLAGGLLLTDATPGLSIFPEELVREVNFACPRRIEGLVNKWSGRPEARKQLISDWRSLILAEHTYYRRMERVLDWFDG